MRRKTFIYWGAILLTVLLVGAGAALLGRGRGPRMTSSLPKPPAGVPYLLVETIADPLNEAGSEGPFGLVRFLPDAEAWKDLMEMGSRVSSGFLLTFGENGQRHWGIFAPGRESVQSFLKGRLPEDWAEIFEESRIEEGRETGNGTWRLIHRRGGELFLRVEGPFLLLADSPEELDRMQSAKNRRLESVASAWRVQPGWTGHLRMTDAGRPWLLPFGIAAENGGKSPSAGPFTMEAAWRGLPPKGGEGAWVWDGTERILSGGKRFLSIPLRWDMKLTFPQPLALAVGCAGVDPSRPEDAQSDDPGDLNGRGRFWRAWTGLPEEKVRGFLKGPVVFSVGGTARAMGFVTPGFLVEFPGRKEEGLDFVRSLLGERWGLSGLLGREVMGFEVGGAIPLPFTVLAAASRETAVLGYLDPHSLQPSQSIRELSPELEVPSIFWAWVDGETLSRELQTLAPENPAYRLMGLGYKEENLRRFLRLTERLGRLVVVMPRADSGHVRWSGVEPQERRP